jgi:UDP-3-O-[3-hydroxymyristoyl] glucosamine N-acyltransferase
LVPRNPEANFKIFLRRSRRVVPLLTLGTGVSVVDHVEIGAKALVGAVSLVTKDVPPGEAVWGTPARRARDAKRESVALRRLPEMLKQLRSRKRAGMNGGATLEPLPVDD